MGQGRTWADALGGRMRLGEDALGVGGGLVGVWEIWGVKRVGGRFGGGGGWEGFGGGLDKNFGSGGFGWRPTAPSPDLERVQYANSG